MKDGANGLELIHQRHDFQYVHYVVYGRDCSVSALTSDLAAVAASGAAVVTISSDRQFSFCLVLLARVVPKHFRGKKCRTFEGEERKKRRKVIEVVNFRQKSLDNFNIQNKRLEWILYVYFWN